MPDSDQSERGCVIAAFPATGKSYYAAAAGRVDSDSSAYSWKWLGPDERVRHPDWPGNYMAHIREALDAGSTVLVSTHAEVRQALAEARIPFTLIYPAPPLRAEYRARMERRGSSAALVAKVIDELWDDALADCAGQTGCVHIVLRSGEYLADVFGG